VLTSHLFKLRQNHLGRVRTARRRGACRCCRVTALHLPSL